MMEKGKCGDCGEGRMIGKGESGEGRIRGRANQGRENAENEGGAGRDVQLIVTMQIY